MSERYPATVNNFTTWFNDRMKQIETACDEYQINEAVEAVRAYADAKWCLAERLETAEALASKVRTKLKLSKKAGLL